MTNPVPSRAALFALRSIVFGTTCSVLLLAEERRRRTRLARTILENGRRLQTRKRHMSSAAVATAIANATLKGQCSHVHRDNTTGSLPENCRSSGKKRRSKMPEEEKKPPDVEIVDPAVLKASDIEVTASARLLMEHNAPSEADYGWEQATSRPTMRLGENERKENDIRTKSEHIPEERSQSQHEKADLQNLNNHKVLLLAKLVHPSTNSSTHPYQPHSNLSISALTSISEHVLGKGLAVEKFILDEAGPVLRTHLGNEWIERAQLRIIEAELSCGHIQQAIDRFEQLMETQQPSYVEYELFIHKLLEQGAFHESVDFYTKTNSRYVLLQERVDRIFKLFALRMEHSDATASEKVLESLCGQLALDIQLRCHEGTLLKLFSHHYSHYANFATIKDYFDIVSQEFEEEKLRELRRTMIYMLGLAVDVKDDDYAQQILDTVPRIGNRREESLFASKRAVIMARKGDWDQVADEMKKMTKHRHSLTSEVGTRLKDFKVVFDEYVGTHTAEEAEEYARQAVERFGMILSPAVVSMIAERWANHGDVEAWARWLEACKKQGFDQSSRFVFIILDCCVKYWRFGYNELKRLEQDLTVEWNGHPSKLSMGLEIYMGRHSGPLQRNSRRAPLLSAEVSNPLVWIKTSDKLVEKRVFTQLRDLSCHDRWQQVRDEYRRYVEEVAPTVPPSPRCMKLAVIAALRLNGQQDKEAYEILEMAKSRGADMCGPLATLLSTQFYVLEQMDRMEYGATTATTTTTTTTTDGGGGGVATIDNDGEGGGVGGGGGGGGAGATMIGNQVRQVVEKALRLGYRVPDSMYNRAIRICLDVKDFANGLAICQVAVKTNGGGNMLYSAEMFSNMVFSMVGTHDHDKLAALLGALQQSSDEAVAWKTDNVCKAGLERAVLSLSKMAALAPSPAKADADAQALRNVRQCLVHVMRCRAVAAAASAGIKRRVRAEVKRLMGQPWGRAERVRRRMHAGSGAVLFGGLPEGE